MLSGGYYRVVWAEHCVYMYMYVQLHIQSSILIGLHQTAYDMLYAVTRLPLFSMVLIFLSTKDKEGWYIHVHVLKIIA